MHRFPIPEYLFTCVVEANTVGINGTWILELLFLDSLFKINVHIQQNKITQSDVIVNLSIQRKTCVLHQPTALPNSWYLGLHVRGFMILAMVMIM